MLAKLSDIAIVTMGQSPKSSAYNSNQDGLPFLQGRTTFGDKYPYFDTWTTEWNKGANKGDILFTVRAPVGDINIATTRIAIGRGIAAITPKSVDSLYLYYLLQANRHIFLTSSAGTIFDSINKDALESIVLNVHNKDEQHHIVNTIGSVDDLIEKNSEIIRKIEILFKLLLDKHKKQATTKFCKLFKCFNGGTFKSSDYISWSEEKLITIRNIDSDGFNTREVTYFKMNQKYKKYSLKISDILLTMTGAYLGRSGIVDEENCYQNQRILKVECKSKAFCYAFLKNNENTIFQLGRGSAQPNLSLEDLNNLDINYDSEAVDNFMRYEYLFKKLLSLKIQNKKLLSIKQKLLNIYF